MPFCRIPAAPHFSFSAGMAATSDARPFGSQALAVAASTPGVTGVEPVETSSVQYNGQTYVAWGLGTHPLYAYRLSAGHWFTGGWASSAPDGASWSGRRTCRITGRSRWSAAFASGPL